MPDKEETIRVLETMLITISLSETERDAIRTAAELLKEQEPVLCKDCKHRGDRHKCIVAFVAEKQEMPYFFYDNRGEWYCADGERK